MFTEISNKDIKIKIGLLSDYSDFSKLLQDLPVFLQTKISTYKNEKDRNLRILGKVLLKDLLIENGHLELGSLDYLHYSGNQKPTLPGIEFSISYANNLAVVGISKHIKFGIDIEKIIKVNINDFEGHFHLDERVAFKKLSDELFFKIWTRKEALSKATGEGVFLPFETISVLSDLIVFAGRKYKFESFEFLPEYSGTICISQ